MGKSFFEKRPVFSIQKLQLSSPLPELRKSQRLKAKASPFLLHLSVLQERKKQLLQIKIVQRRILCKIENVILIKIGILN